MQIKKIQKILTDAKPLGWIMEPQAKQLLAAAGICVPRFTLARDCDTALEFAAQLGYPVVAKIVSPAIIHKSEVGGVKPGIRNEGELKAVFHQFSGLPEFAGVLVEELLSGVELIVGGKVDQQFGPVVLLGMGGIGVEIYKDTTIRMAPISERDIHDMLGQLTAGKMLYGFRGRKPIHMESLVGLLLSFSTLLMKIANDISSVDLNPVMCAENGCVVADARIMLGS